MLDALVVDVDGVEEAAEGALLYHTAQFDLAPDGNDMLF